MSDVPERWTQARVYPDMWTDPDQDPRNSDGVSPDGELATLQDYVRGYRLTLLMKCEGMTPGQLARRSVPPSTLSLLGLVRHLAECERDWRTWIHPDRPEPALYGPGDAAFDNAKPEQTLAERAFAGLNHEQTATDTLLAAYPDLGTRVGPKNIAIREVWIHRIEEYARHCGHADLLRERIDGRVGQ
ncbi:MAG TPA: DinB family protein [Streptosporangiaceae bacterium]